MAATCVNAAVSKTFMVVSGVISQTSQVRSRLLQAGSHNSGETGYKISQLVPKGFHASLT